jgi:hypothetical protein
MKSVRVDVRIVSICRCPFKRANTESADLNMSGAEYQLHVIETNIPGLHGSRHRDSEFEKSHPE